jgi:hypothetical protein
MSLDIILLNEDNTQKKRVSVRLDDYSRLKELLYENGHLLKRLHDYYEDVEFKHGELNGLIEELSMLGERCYNENRFLFSLKLSLI